MSEEGDGGRLGLFVMFDGVQVAHAVVVVSCCTFVMASHSLFEEVIVNNRGQSRRDWTKVTPETACGVEGHQVMAWHDALELLICNSYCSALCST